MIFCWSNPNVPSFLLLICRIFLAPKRSWSRPVPILQRQVNQELGEIGGVFVSKQPSDTDMGAKEPKTVLLKGIFYGKVRRVLPW